MLEVLEKDVYAENIEDDGWQNLDWHDWRLATKDKNIKDYLTKQIKEAVGWYYRTGGEIIPGYDKSKDLEEYDIPTQLKINEALNKYLQHVDESSGLVGSENFARKYLMYRADVAPEKIVSDYKKWEEGERLTHAQAA
jgi:hypothetical protein